MITSIKEIFRHKNLFNMSIDSLDREIFSRLYNLGVEVEEDCLYVNGTAIMDYEINLTSNEYHLCICCYTQYLLLRSWEKEYNTLRQHLTSTESKISLTNEINKSMSDKIEASENKKSKIIKLRRSKFVCLK